MQRSSHRSLISDRSADVSTTSRGRRLDAIIVPAARRAPRLRSVARLAAQYDTLLVILASHECTVEEAASLVGSTPGSRALIIEIPDDHTHDLLKLETSSKAFHDVNAGRKSNLSHKRNLGLMLSRLLGWEKIMFMDDDISRVTTSHLTKVATQLERHHVTGLVSMSFPDNSVVCHANRLCGADQDVFITGATLGVNMSAKPLDFFPDIYNEDWLAFASHAQAGRIISVGEGRQQGFNPYDDPQRAAREEFGDVIAEGLYSLFDEGRPLERATTTYWREFIDVRRSLIDQITETLPRIETYESVQAQESMRHARKQLDSIEPEDCWNFVSAWCDDRVVVDQRISNLKPVAGYAAARECLGLGIWRQTEFGLDKAPSFWASGTSFSLSGLQSLGRRRSPVAS